MDEDELYARCPLIAHAIGSYSGYTVQTELDYGVGEEAVNDWAEGKEEINIGTCEISFMHKECWKVCL